jgi:hypothetical protein
MWNIVLVSLVTALIPVVVEAAQKYIREDSDPKKPPDETKEKPTQDSSKDK